MQHPSLVIFDMDGLMFDTEKMASNAWFLSAEHYGFEIDHSIIHQFVGMTNEDILKEMKVVYGEHAPIHEWRSFMRESKRKLIDEYKYQPDFKKKGLDSLLSYLKSVQVLTAVASSSEKETIRQFLNVTDTAKYIDFYVSGEEVVNGKPNPDIFLKACQKANVSPSEALVLEDSPAGIRAAQRAGIPSFFIPDTVKETQELTALTKKVFPSLMEVEQYLRSIAKVND